jgi:hypothetical protein
MVTFIVICFLFLIAITFGIGFLIGYGIAMKEWRLAEEKELAKAKARVDYLKCYSVR